MKIIPVIDLLDGQVVHAVRGEREKYKPVESLLVFGSDPVDVAGALIKESGSSELYIADLDAIQGKGNNSRIIAGIGAELGVSLMVDAGCIDADSVLNVKKSGADTVILGSETFSDLNEITHITDKIPADELLFSIDISHGKVISKADELNGSDPIDALSLLSEKDIRRFILLSLDMVGSGEGPGIELIKRAVSKFPGHVLIAGGGVKYNSHLEQLKSAGADGVLVATALHRGWLTEKQIYKLSAKSISA